MRGDFPCVFAFSVNINLLELGIQREHRYVETSAHEGVLQGHAGSVTSNHVGRDRNVLGYVGRAKS